MGSTGEGAMPRSAVKVNGAKVATEGPGQTVVNVHISQESSLVYLFKAMVAAMRRPKAASKAQEGSPAATPRAGNRCSGEQKVLGAVQILLGLMCIALGVVISLNLAWEGPRYGRVIYNGAPFWMGSVCILAGTFSVVGERRRGGWVHLATFFNLASVVAGSVALALGVADVPSMTYRPYYIDELCQKRRPGYRSWEANPTPSYDESDDARRAENCKEKMWQLTTVANSVRLLLLLISIAALGVAVFCLGYGLRRLCCSIRAGCEDYVAIGDPEAPPSYEAPPEKEGDSA